MNKHEVGTLYVKNITKVNMYIHNTYIPFLSIHS